MKIKYLLLIVLFVPFVYSSPLIENITVQSTTNQSTSILWDTNETSNSLVQYGTTLPLSNTETNNSNVTNHIINLSDLTPNTFYYFNVSSCNHTLCSVSDLLNFTTDGIPSIENLTQSVTNESATITWDTHKNSTSVVDYGVDLNLDNQTTNSTNVTAHSINLVNLTPGIRYYYNVSSCNMYGCNKTGNHEFRTKYNNNTCHPINETIRLSRDIYINGSCFSFAENYTSLFCDGYSIIGNGSGIGVNSSNRILNGIIDCNFINFTYGVYTDNSVVDISNTTVDYSDYSYYFIDSNNVFYNLNLADDRLFLYSSVLELQDSMNATGDSDIRILDSLLYSSSFLKYIALYNESRVFAQNSNLSTELYLRDNSTLELNHSTFYAEEFEAAHYSKVSAFESTINYTGNNYPYFGHQSKSNFTNTNFWGEMLMLLYHNTTISNVLDYNPISWIVESDNLEFFVNLSNSNISLVSFYSVENTSNTITNSSFNQFFSDQNSNTTIRNTTLDTMWTSSLSENHMISSHVKKGILYESSENHFHNSTIHNVNLELTPGIYNINNTRGGLQDKEINLFYFNNTNITNVSLEFRNSVVVINNSNIGLECDASNTTVYDSLLIDLDIDSGKINFSGTTVTNYLSLSNNPVIFGNVDMPEDIYLFGNATRFFPTYIINHSGLPVPYANISVRDGDTNLYNISADQDGFVVINMTFNSSKSYSVYTNKTIGNFSIASDTPLNFSTDTTPPNITDYEPKQEVEEDHTLLVIWTDEWARCRYSTTNATPYYEMNGTFFRDGTENHAALENLEDGEKTYYVRCMDKSRRISDEFAVNFTVDIYYYVGGGGGGGGGTMPAPMSLASKYWNTIIPEGKASMEIYSEQVPFTKITFGVDEQVSDAELKIYDTEVSRSPPGRVYKMMNITKNFHQEVRDVEFRFRVKRIWLNGSSSDDISLYHYKNGWHKLPTTKLNTETKYVHYKANADSFSVFAVSLFKEPEQEPPEPEPQVDNHTEQNTTQDQEPDIEQEPSEPDVQVQKRKKPSILPFVLIGIFIFVTIILVVIFSIMKRERPTDSKYSMDKAEEYVKAKKGSQQAYHNYPQVDDFVKKCMQRGIDKKFIKKALLEKGWTEDIVDFYIIKNM